MFCPECGKELMEGAQFCGNCGRAVVREEAPAARPGPEPEQPALSQCVQCGAPLKEGAAFCGECGTAVTTQPATAAIQTAPVQPEAPVPKKKTARIGLAAAGIAVVLALAAVVLLVNVRVDDVYVCGNIRNGDERQAVYWKNGKLIQLPVEAGRSDAFSIYADDSGVIVAGVELDLVVPGSDTKFYVPKYWKNGRKYALENQWLGENTAMHVVNGDVYQVASNDGMNDFVQYWKNGKQTVHLDKSIASVHSVYVDGSGVYLAGFIDRDAVTSMLEGREIGSQQSTNNEAVYWKDGEVHFLSPRPSMASTIVVSGSNVYAAGVALVDDKSRAAYWKNTNETVFTGTPGQSAANSLFTAGDDVYIAGRRDPNDGEAGQALYWKINEVSGGIIDVPLSPGVQGGAQSIVVVDEDVYVCGFQASDTGDFPAAVYWKNGRAVKLSEQESFASSIYVVRKSLWDHIRGK